MKTSSSIWALLGFVLLVLGGCTSPKPKPQTSSQVRGARYDTTAVHLALMPTADCFPFYYAERTGIYRQLGLKVSIHSYVSQLDCDTALMGRYMDAGYADAVRMKDTRLGSAPLVTLAHGTDLWQLVVSGPLRVKTADKLKDRLVAVARQSAEDAYLTSELRKGGTKPDDVFRPLVNDVKLRAEMVGRRQVDATLLRWPFTSLALSSGDRVIASQKAGDSQVLLVARKRSLTHRLEKSRLDLLKKGYAMGLDSIAANPRERISRVLQQDYLLPREVADTVRCPRSGFFK